MRDIFKNKDIYTDFYVSSLYTEGTHCQPSAAIMNYNKVPLPLEIQNKFYNFPYVAGIDIFPLDYIAADEEDDKFQCDLIDIVWTVEKLARNIENKCNEINLEKAPAELELRRQVEEMVEQKGEFVAMPQARAQTMHYMKGLKGAASLRRYCCELSRLSDLDTLIDAVFEQQRRAAQDPDDTREVPFP